MSAPLVPMREAAAKEGARLTGRRTTIRRVLLQVSNARAASR